MHTDFISRDKFGGDAVQFRGASWGPGGRRELQRCNEAALDLGRVSSPGPNFVEGRVCVRAEGCSASCRDDTQAHLSKNECGESLTHPSSLAAICIKVSPII